MWGGHGRAHGERVPRVPRGGYAPEKVHLHTEVTMLLCTRLIQLTSTVTPRHCITHAVFTHCAPFLVQYDGGPKLCRLL